MQTFSGSAKDLCTLLLGSANDTMTTIEPATLASPPTSRGGGRFASDRYRQSLQQSDDFAGLETNANRYDLLLLVKRAGKAAGFSPRMIQLLDYYMAFTRDIDWEEGSRPIVYQSLARTALDMGVSERQIQKLESRLFEVGAITWSDSGNHKRFGQRDAKTGRILYAYGVELTPLAHLREELEDRLHEKQLYDQAWMETKRQISWYRCQIRGLIQEIGLEEGAAEGLERSYGRIAVRIRTHLSLEELRGLLAKHQVLHDEALTIVAELTPERAARDEQTFAHHQTTTYQSLDKSNTGSPAGIGFQESVVEPTEPEADKPAEEGTDEASEDDPILATGLQHLTLKQVLQAAGSQVWECLPPHQRPLNWNDLVEAAYRRRQQLGVSQSSWGDACQRLGRIGAAVCLIVTDRASQREENRVRNPAAYFAGMLKKQRTGGLRLHHSVFGLLESDPQIDSSENE